MDVKLRYARTELGLIPSDWSVFPLGQLVSSVEYGSSAKSSIKGQIPVLRMGNLQGGRIEWSNLVFTNDTEEISKYALQGGDVLFNRTNTIDLVGKTALFKGERPAIFAGYLIRIKVDKRLLDARLLNYVLNAEFSRQHSAKVLSVAVGQANINGQKLKAYPIPVPPTKAEQGAIADALSDADALIESLERFIAKKRDIKQGAMQEILSGKHLPGFSGEWKATALREGITLLSGQHVLAPHCNTEGFGCPYITGPADFTTGVIRHTKFTERPTTICRANDILVTVKGSGVGSMVFSNGDYCISRQLMAVRVDGKIWDPRFVYLSLLHDSALINSAATGLIPGISRADLLNKKIPAPPLAEQKAIATVIDDMAAEIAVLEGKLTKVKQLKQGMMQGLLTGRIRLV